jgi:hypothetical protein
MPSGHLGQHSFRLWEPESHLHGAVQLDSSGQRSAGLGAASSLGIQLPETQVAVRLERAHTEGLGQGQGLLVVGCGQHGIGRVGVGRDGAKLVQRERLDPALLPLPG